MKNAGKSNTPLPPIPLILGKDEQRGKGKTKLKFLAHDKK